MVGSMIYDVLHGLPKRIAIDAEFKGFVFHHAVEVVLRQPVSEPEQRRILRVPMLAKAGRRCELLLIRKCRGRPPLKTLQPHPLSRANVPQGVAYRRKAGTERARE